MKENLGPVSTRMRWALTGVTAVLTLALVVIMRHGPGLTPDSYSYLSAARALAHHGRLTIYDGTSLVAFPPGLSVALAGLLRLGLGLTPATVTLNALGYAATAVGIFGILRVVLHRDGIALALTAALLATGTFLSFYLVLLSEPVFLGVTFLALAALLHGVARGRLTPRTLTLVVLGAGVTELWRFTGVVIVPAVVLAWLFTQAWPWRLTTLVRAAGLGALASLGALVVVVRDLALGTGPFGPTVTSSTPLGQIPQQIAHLAGSLASSSLVVPFTSRYPSWYESGSRAELLVGAVLIALVVAGVGRALRRRDLPVILLAAFTGLYWALLVYAESSNTQFNMNPRLAAPTAAGDLALAAYALAPLARGSAKALLGRLGLAGLTLAVSAGALTLVSYTAQPLYGVPPVAVTPAVHVVDHLPASVGVLTEDGAKLYWNSGHVPVVDMPAPSFFCPPDCVRAVEHRIRHDVRDHTLTYAIFGSRLSGREQANIVPGVSGRLVRAGAGYALYRLSVR